MQEEVLFNITNGLYVISARHKDLPGTYAGSLVDAVSQICVSPNLIILSCMNSGYTKKCIEEAQEFGISILPQDINPFVIGNFGFQSSRNIDKWNNVLFSITDGLPYLNDAIGKIRAKVINKITYPNNTLFIAEIQDAFDYRASQPLTYQYYRSGFKKKVLEAFSLWQQGKNSVFPSKDTKTEISEQQNSTKRWTCKVCGYVYDGEIPFEELPDDWLCPLCGVGKEFFELR